MSVEDESRTARRRKLEECGAQTIAVPLNDTYGSLDLLAVLSSLRERSIRSVMAEGGQRIISSFLQLRDQANAVVDTLIITISPTMVGGQGVEALEPSTLSPNLEHKSTVLMGRDVVMALRIVP
ncbi:2,5-diamino-6-(ribosylamino)-4(3H)-pyrimidinone 5'-phosphate reductase [Tulasnella sp. 419]|nr:2,5-diamino-6-(ribosylamino)-4(3H)-pyrimidinone 5'-phosphate reductase [Tulasnella sp. 419]